MTCSYVDTYDEISAPCVGWEERVVVARKAHRCGECGAPIAPGERYGRASGVILPGFDADPGPCTWKRCMACVVEADRLQALFKLCIPWGALLRARADLEWSLEQREEAS